MKSLCAGLWLAAALLGRAADPLAQYDVVWDSPSTNHHGSMPLGNGEVAVNAWVTAAGDLHLYLARTDAWDDYARLVKVGKVRLQIFPNPFTPGVPFRQTLSLRDATLRVEAGEGAARTRLQVWVDAHHPVVHVTLDSAAPRETTAFLELWRTQQMAVATTEVSDVLMHRKDPSGRQEGMLIEPDTVLENYPDGVGWYHHNRKSIGPALMAQIQGLTGFPQPDPLLHRTFGTLVTAPGAQRLNDRTLRAPPATAQRFSIFVTARHPATPAEWLADADAVRRRFESTSFALHRTAHEAWWREFWERSWIRATLNTHHAAAQAEPLAPANRHPLRVGFDSGGGNRYRGELGRVSVLGQALTDAEIAALAATGPQQSLPAGARVLFTATNVTPHAVPGSTNWAWPPNFTAEAWVRPEKLPGGGARVLDKLTAGQRDGFLLDTYPGNSLRWIVGQHELTLGNAVPAGQWTHIAAVADAAAGGCRLYVNGRLAASDMGAAVKDEAAYISQMYHLQRFITACAGRGNYPIKFNGSLFTVPPGPTEKDPDYRRWGPGYWWQNTRLPYLSLCASGDFDLQQPLFRMYARDLLPLCRYRTQLYCGHAGAFYPECIMFWGAIFSETYGWTPFEQRQDKLQESGWHKYEWLCGLELGWMMMDYYEHTLDREFLQQSVLPLVREVLTFFDRHYPTNASGQLVMYPSQAVETWWRCTNAVTELSGCIALTERLLALPATLAPAADRRFWQQFRAKLPPIPLREIRGRKALAPAAFFADKRNVENPELYPVFPFRLFAFNRPNVDWALAALEHREDKGHFGWRQDDIFMAYLGLAEEARKGLVWRARHWDRNERFPAFWGPNYDWTPDQDHGGVLMKTFQAMLLQTDGPRIFLFPAWPKAWDVDFKLHAPQRTVIEGAYRNGRLVSWQITPAQRKADVVIVAP
jgi:hypothetical protein